MPKRSVREQSPPIERAAISRIQAPSVVHAQLGVDRTLPQAEGRGAAAAAAPSARLLRPPGQPRRRDVDRLLEVRARRADRACRRARARAARPRSGAPRARPPRRGRSPRRGSPRPLAAAPGAPAGSARIAAIRRQAAWNCAGIVGADDAAARREKRRLEDARIADLPRRGAPVARPARRARWRGERSARPAPGARRMPRLVARRPPPPRPGCAAARGAAAIAAAATAVSSSTPTTASIGVVFANAATRARAGRRVAEVEGQQARRVEPLHRARLLRARPSPSSAERSAAAQEVAASGSSSSEAGAGRASRSDASPSARRSYDSRMKKTAQEDRRRRPRRRRPAKAGRRRPAASRSCATRRRARTRLDLGVQLLEVAVELAQRLAVDLPGGARTRAGATARPCPRAPSSAPTMTGSAAAISRSASRSWPCLEQQVGDDEIERRDVGAHADRLELLLRRAVGVDRRRRAGRSRAGASRAPTGSCARATRSSRRRSTGIASREAARAASALPIIP